MGTMRPLSPAPSGVFAHVWPFQNGDQSPLIHFIKPTPHHTRSAAFVHGRVPRVPRTTVAPWMSMTDATVFGLDEAVWTTEAVEEPPGTPSFWGSHFRILDKCPQSKV